MNFDVKRGENKGEFLPMILDGSFIVAIAETAYPSRLQAMHWVADKLAEVNPGGPVRMTRTKVYNDRVIGRPGFWEFTTYDSNGNRLRTGQWSDVMQESYLRCLVEDQLGFPMEMAEEI